MSTFPAQYSTLSATALKDHIAAAYHLDILACKYLLRGVSDTYILTAANARYVFKVYRDQHRSHSEILGEVELLNLLKEKGASVAYPLKDVQGQSLQTFNAPEGTRYGILFSYAEGKPVLDLNDDKLRTIGREMAAVHNITSVIELSHTRRVYSADTTLIQPIKILEPVFADMPDEYHYLKETATKVIEKLNMFDTAKFSYGYCQYDFLPKNFHFTEGGELTFFDFHFAGKGYLANDLMSFLCIFLCMYLPESLLMKKPTACTRFLYLPIAK